MLNYIEFLNLPAKVAIILVGIILFMNVVGELLELMGAIVPEFIKFRKYFQRKKKEKQENIETLREVKTLLNDVNLHYSQDNIAKRDAWMDWVNSRAKIYDSSIVELNNQYKEVTSQLKANTEITLDLYININRHRIIDFASKVINDHALVSREEFNRIFKVYDEYEDILEKHGKTNGEVDVAYNIILESYEKHMKEHSFIEDIRWNNAN